MRVLRVSEIPYGGAMYVQRDPGGETVVFLDAATYSQEQADRLARKLGSGQGPS